MWVAAQISNSELLSVGNVHEAHLWIDSHFEESAKLAYYPRKPRQGVYLSDFQILLSKRLNRGFVIMAPLKYKVSQKGSFCYDICKDVTGSSYESTGLKTMIPLRRRRVSKLYLLVAKH